MSDTVSDDNTVRFTRKGLATRARVVNVAAKLMFERGVSGTSMDELRSTASVLTPQRRHGVSLSTATGRP